MSKKTGKFLGEPVEKKKEVPITLLYGSFFLIEVFAFCFLNLSQEGFSLQRLWPLAFGVLWAGILGSVGVLLPGKAGRTGYGLVYFGFLLYGAVETGYYLLFSEMMWLSDFRYASEGADYLDVMLQYPALWWLALAALAALGAINLRWFPRDNSRRKKVLAAVLAASSAVGAAFLPEAVFVSDQEIRYAGSDYGRAQSAEAAYDNLFNAHRLYQVCGLYQTLVKDVCANVVYPLTPAYQQAREQATETIDAYFAQRQETGSNDMTGLLEGKNVVLVLMESMDDWMIGEHTPVLAGLMEEGIQFTRFYTPGYGGIRTFNTEFCINTGSFLSSQGGYAFDYVTNEFNQSLANRLREQGYSAMTFHYNDPSFYSRGEFSPAMGYEEYVSYQDYVTDVEEKIAKDMLYDDQLLFDNEELKAEFFREGAPTLNFLITRSAHLSYKYNEVLSYWGLKKYPQYKGLTGNEETDCAYLKARLVDDLFGRLLEELEENGTLEDTVIIGVTDHYTYGYKDTDSLLALSGVEDTLLLERTPCFIWSPGLEARKVDKVLNTADFLPTVLNLLGVEGKTHYIGRDAFDESYDGFVPFSNGSWIIGDTAYDAGSKKLISISGKQQTVTAEFQKEMAQRVQEFVGINNLILDADYYREGE